MNQLSIVRARPVKAALLGLMLSACAHLPTTAPTRAPDTQWDAYLGGGDSSQYSALDQINRGNVAGLEVAWTYQVGDGQPPRFNPLVVDGVLYVIAGNALVALDPASGRELWKRPQVGRVSARGMNFWRSADGSDRRLLFVNDGMLRAVSAETGEPIASFGSDGKVDLRVGLNGDITKIRELQTDNPGRVFENLIIMSLPAGGADYASSPGDIHAYDVVTGKLVWMFHTVPHAGEPGAETWPAADRERFGGVHNWSESTIDHELGIAFIPTGTARFDFYGGNRPGDNLYANSILALDARTGKRIWHYQTIHHDLWDYDLPTAPKLMTIRRNGRDVPILVQPSKQGFLFVLDRRTGKPIWPIPEVKVPASDVPGERASPTQPIPSWPKPFARQSFTEADINPHIPEAEQAKLREMLRSYRNEGLFTPPSVRGTIQMPGHNGGTNWGGTASDPERKRVYVVAKSLPTTITLTPDKREGASAAIPNPGGDVTAYRAPVNFLLAGGLSAAAPPWSTITAYDMTDGRMLWQRPNGDIPSIAARGVEGAGSQSPRGGPVATGGGLLFSATASDRKFRARDGDTGAVLWEYALPAGSEGVPAVYEADGRQFIVIPVGGQGMFGGDYGLPKAGPSQYIAFALPARTSTSGER